MKVLTQIVRVLKPAEVRLIRNFYKVQPNGEIKRRLELFELIKGGKANTDIEAAKAIYKSEPNSAFSHLKTVYRKTSSIYYCLRKVSRNMKQNMPKQCLIAAECLLKAKFS